MLNLKEACRLHNHLDSVIDNLLYYFRDGNNSTKTKETHLKSLSNPDAKDEVIESKVDRPYGEECSIVDITYLINDVIAEKTSLSNAIAKSKNTDIYIDVDGIVYTFDSAVECAKKTRALAGSIKPLLDIKSREVKTTGVGLKFNAEGNQVSYRYDVEKVVTIDFDRNNLNKSYKNLLEKADKLSTKIESAMLLECIDFNPLYNLHDSIDEIVEKHLSKKKS